MAMASDEQALRQAAADGNAEAMHLVATGLEAQARQLEGEARNADARVDGR
jgi:hypothetical protein